MATRPSDASTDSLASLLEGYLRRDGRSLNRIAQAALVDVAYLWRLKAGERRAPSRDVLIRLALALRLEPEELDELLVAADYAPITLRRA
jgi:hypothetical protein